MNRMVVLFACWLLLLTGLPCPDADCHAHGLTTHSQTTSGQNAPVQGDPVQGDPIQGDPVQDDHKAPCSPFCHCTACLGFSLPAPAGYLLPSVDQPILLAAPLFAYQSPALPDVVQGIWQPPQLRR